MTKAPMRPRTRGGDSLTFTDGAWSEDTPKLIGPDDHAMWLGSVVFDGARALSGHAPDLDRHCARAIRSCRVLGLEPNFTAEEVAALAREGIAKFPPDAELYICPMFYATKGFMVPDPQSTQFVLTVQDAPLPKPKGFSACLSRFRRPARDMAPTEAKASCHYPNISLDIADANRRGFDVSVVLDPSGNVAEFSYANLFAVKDGTVFTPAANGTFLNGITRQRVIKLLRDAGTPIEETTLTPADLDTADEMFATGNYAKLMPCTRFEGRTLAPGPVYERARGLYLAFIRRC